MNDDLILLLWLLWLFDDAEDESLDSELNKQIQIRRVDDTTSNQVGHVVTAFSWGIFATTILVVVHRHNNEVGAGNHLTDLHQGDDPRRKPLGDGLDGLQEVVEIHDGMDSVVHGGKIVAVTGFSDIGVPAEEEYSNVVVPVQEDKRLLSQDNEHSVDEFWKLGQAEQHDGQTRSTHTVSQISRLANSLHKWSGVHHKKSGGNHTNHTIGTEQ